jgi:hypothetical protein
LATEPRWSLDDKRLVFWGTYWSGHRNASYLISADGGRLEPVPTPDGQEWVARARVGIADGRREVVGSFEGLRIVWSDWTLMGDWNWVGRAPDDSVITLRAEHPGDLRPRVGNAVTLIGGTWPRPSPADRVGG